MNKSTNSAAIVAAVLLLAARSDGGSNNYGIGFKFAANEPTNSFASQLAPTDVAGLPSVAQANWNNLTLKTNNPAVPVVIVANSNGTAIATSVSVAWSANGTWANYGHGENNGTSFLTSSPADVKLMNGYIDSGNATTTMITITNLPADLTTPGYDVYVYALASVAGRAGLVEEGLVRAPVVSQADDESFENRGELPWKIVSMASTALDSGRYKKKGRRTNPALSHTRTENKVQRQRTEDSRCPVPRQSPVLVTGPPRSCSIALALSISPKIGENQ